MKREFWLNCRVKGDSGPRKEEGGAQEAERVVVGPKPKS